jgi:plastocyanin
MKSLAIAAASLLAMAIALPNAGAHVALDFPVGGETFTEGDMVDVQWHIVIPHDLQNWDLYFSQDGGMNWEAVVLDIPPEEMNYLWTAPGIETDQGRLMIYMDNTGNDYQDESGDFTIELLGGATEHFVSIPGFEFSPPDLSISPGDIVTWTNDHTITHTTTSDDGGVEWDSGDLLPGESFSHTFDMAGIYPYLCTIHPSMTGIVTVESSCGFYVTGDYNGSGAFNVSDIVEGYSRLKTGEPSYPDLNCDCAGDGNLWPVRMDVNNTCTFNVADIVDGYSNLKTGMPDLMPCEQCPPL